MTRPSLCLATALASVLGLAAPAHAIDLPGTGLSLSGGATVVTDYRFRGISQSAGKVAKQGWLTLSHENGLYAGGWVSEIDLYDDDPDTGFRDGSDLEVDATFGWSKDVLPLLTLDANVTYYIYPGVTGPTNYGEASASAALSLGLVEAKLGASWFPDQAAMPDDGTYLYAEATATLPLLFALTGHVGRQSFGPGFGPDADYWNWSVTASKCFGPLEASVSLVDTSLPAGNRAGTALVASIGVAF